MNIEPKIVQQTEFGRDNFYESSQTRVLWNFNNIEVSIMHLQGKATKFEVKFHNDN